MVRFWGFGVLRFWGFEMVDGETLGTYSLLRPISRPLNLSISRPLNLLPSSEEGQLIF